MWCAFCVSLSASCCRFLFHTCAQSSPPSHPPLATLITSATRRLACGPGPKSGPTKIDSLKGDQGASMPRGEKLRALIPVRTPHICLSVILGSARPHGAHHRRGQYDQRHCLHAGLSFKRSYEPIHERNNLMAFDELSFRTRRQTGTSARRYWPHVHGLVCVHPQAQLCSIYDLLTTPLILLLRLAAGIVELLGRQFLSSARRYPKNGTSPSSTRTMDTTCPISGTRYDLRLPRSRAYQPGSCRISACVAEDHN
ncbi:hypothetical protein V8E36_001638 [Tilletia maclaganii]